MTNRIFSIVLLIVAAMLTDNSHVAAQTTAQPKLTITDAKIADSRIPPNFMQVNWDLTGLGLEDRVINYQLTVHLSANGQEGEVVQTPRAELKTVMVGLPAIPNDVRTKIFTGGQIVSAKISMRATIIHRGARKEIFAFLQKGIQPLGIAPAPKPSPEQIRDGLQRRKARVIERR